MWVPVGGGELACAPFTYCIKRPCAHNMNPAYYAGVLEKPFKGIAPLVCKSSSIIFCPGVLVTKEHVEDEYVDSMQSVFLPFIAKGCTCRTE